MKIEVRKHKDRTIRNLYGEVLRREYYYTIAIRRWCMWFHLKFYVGGYKLKPMVVRCLEAETVHFNTMPRIAASRFYDEADAIRVKLDIIQNPDKYVT